MRKRPGRGIGVDGPLHGAKHPRHDLPLVEQDRFTKTAQGGVGIGPDRDRLSLAIEAHDGGGPARSGRGLAGRSRPRDEDRRQLGQ